MNHDRVNRMMMLAVTLLLGMQFSLQAHADTIEVAQQPLERALLEYSKQTGLQIAYVSALVQGKTSPGTRGRTDRDKALTDILEGTGLKHQFVNAGTVAIGPDQSASAYEPNLTARSKRTDDGNTEDADELDEEKGASALAGEDEPLSLGYQTVTGSRLMGGDPSARVYAFTAEEIAARGVSSLEDFFRRLPFTASTVTTQIANTSAVREVEEISFPLNNGTGISAVNLRGMGVANTLVLMDGKRIAGVGGLEADFVNLLNLPLSTIERVEVQLDGASAVYGSDAIGGVVNFITRKNYRGLAVGYRHEDSSSDADQTQARIIGGWGWGSGNVTAAFSRNTSEPIVNIKTGWHSLDFRSYLGVEFDQRHRGIGQPGVVCLPQKIQYPFSRAPYWSCGSWRRGYYQLPADHSGVNASIEDFIFSAISRVFRLDEMVPENGADYTTESVLLKVEQYVNEDLQLFASLHWSYNDSYQEYDRTPEFPFLVPASNAYNPFGETVQVRYAPLYEYENGLLPKQHTRGENELRTIGFGLDWTFMERQELKLALRQSKSWRLSDSYRVGYGRGVLAPTGQRYYASLASPDPAQAYNFFGNGTAQSGDLEAFIGQSGLFYAGVNETLQYNLTLRGQFFQFWGGPAHYSLGAEVRDNFVYADYPGAGHDVEILGEFETEGLKGRERTIGVERPKRSSRAYYAELSVPVFGIRNARAGMQSLTVTLQGRVDVNEMQGASSAQAAWEVVAAREWWWDPDTGFEYFDTTAGRLSLIPALETVRQTGFSPRVGLHYKPASDFTFRVAWRRSFKSPNWSDMFSTQPESSITHTIRSYGPKPLIDPYDPDGPTELVEELGVIRRYVWYTPDVEPEHSNNWTFSIEWAPGGISGLRWTANLAIVDLTNMIDDSGRWFSQDLEGVLSIPEVAIRNERGDLLEFHSRRINIAEKYNEMLISTLEYTFDTRFGRFSPRVSYVGWLEDFTQLLPNSAKVSSVGRQWGLDRYKLQGSLGWHYGNIAANVFVYYTPGYVHDKGLRCWSEHLRLPETRCVDAKSYLELQVSSLTTVDLTLRYRMENGLSISVGGRNILNRAAPRTLSHSYRPVPYDPLRWDARGRVLFVDLKWEM